jgi:competence protein ComEA
VSRPTPSWWLKRTDQAALAVINGVALLAILAWWLWQGGPRGELIEVDRQSRTTVPFRIDINSADWPELTLLPEIGENLAKRIVESRQTTGPFRDHDDLRRVRGIGPRTLERMRPYLEPVEGSEGVARN